MQSAQCSTSRQYARRLLPIAEKNTPSPSHPHAALVSLARRGWFTASEEDADVDVFLFVGGSTLSEELGFASLP